MSHVAKMGGGVGNPVSPHRKLASIKTETPSGWQKVAISQGNKKVI